MRLRRLLAVTLAATGAVAGGAAATAGPAQARAKMRWISYQTGGGYHCIQGG
jgi:hypothetical protein